MLDRDATSVSGGRLTIRVGLFLVAMLLGSLLPVGAVALLAVRDPLPPSCRTGRATSQVSEGTIIYADRAALWLAQGDAGHASKLLDFEVPTSSPSPASPPSAPGLPGSSPVSSPSGAAPSPRILAATISRDHHILALVVSDPPGAAGKFSVRVFDPLQPPPLASVEAWSGSNANASGPAEITMLPQDKVLFRVPQHLDSPETSSRLVGVVSPGATPKLLQSAPERQFDSSLHASWPETQDYQLPDDQPRLDSRVLGPGGMVAGLRDHRFRSPLADRSVHQVVTGRLGQSGTTTVCGVTDDLTPAALSPDGKALALSGGGSSYVLDPSGGHGAAFLLHGRVLDWRP